MGPEFPEGVSVGRKRPLFARSALGSIVVRGLHLLRLQLLQQTVSGFELRHVQSDETWFSDWDKTTGKEVFYRTSDLAALDRAHAPRPPLEAPAFHSPPPHLCP